MFVVADRRAFAGLTADQRIVVLSPSEFALAGDRFGVQYPGHIQLYVDHSGTQGIVIWNESWRGMTIRLKKVDGIWTTEVVSQWITY